jgi:hypothetical protein
MSKKVLEKVLSGLSDRNIRFSELCSVLRGLGFIFRTVGSHYIFFREGVAEIINIQALPDGKAKAYQVKQVRAIIMKYKLHQGI